MGAEPEFSFEFILQIVLVLLTVVAMIFIGYKIKEGWGAVIAILICAFFFLYINSLLWDLLGISFNASTVLNETSFDRARFFLDVNDSKGSNGPAFLLSEL